MPSTLPTSLASFVAPVLRSSSLAEVTVEGRFRDPHDFADLLDRVLALIIELVK